MMIRPFITDQRDQREMEKWYLKMY